MKLGQQARRRTVTATVQLQPGYAIMKMGMRLPRVRALLCGVAGRLGGDGWDVAQQPRKTFGRWQLACTRSTGRGHQATKTLSPREDDSDDSGPAEGNSANLGKGTPRCNK